MQKRKLECGKELEVLGVDISFSAYGVHMLPSAAKRRKWVDKLKNVLQDGVLHAGEASKLSGALNWAGQQAFKRVGRAMLVPIRAQIRSKSSAIGTELRLALQWFVEVLELGLNEVATWDRQRRRPIHMYCDARGEPPRVAAVLIA